MPGIMPSSSCRRTQECASSCARFAWDPLSTTGCRNIFPRGTIWQVVKALLASALTQAEHRERQFCAGRLHAGISGTVHLDRIPCVRRCCVVAAADASVRRGGCHAGRRAMLGRARGWHRWSHGGEVKIRRCGFESSRVAAETPGQIRGRLEHGQRHARYEI